MSYFITESSIFSEAAIVKQTPTKAIFRMPLQTCDEVNQNNRLYPKPTMMSSMDDCRERLERKAFYGEMDHPIPQGNEQFDGIRQTTVSLERVSHYILDYEFQGNILMGECETASTRHGKNLFGLIKDRSGVGMSMRGMAGLEQEKDYNRVQDPLVIIAYDAVSQPSHKSAVVNFNEMKFERYDMLTESASGVVCCGGKCYMPNYFDKLVETKMIEFYSNWR